MSSALPAAAPDLFDALFDLSLTGSVLYDPVRDARGAVVDFRFSRLNPVAQNLLRLPAQVEKTYLGRFPAARTTGAFDLHRAAFEGEEARHFEQHYQADGHDYLLRIAARRVGAQLLVSFTNASDQPRTAIEQALHESRAQGQQAQAAAEAERLRLHQMLMRMPANIALLRGPEHIYDLVNPAYEQLFPARTTLGRSLREVIPEIAGQGFYELFDRVYQTGEPFYEPEAEAWADFAGTGELQRRYYRTTLEPIRNAQGEVAEVLNFAVDITAQVEARQQVEQLNHELEARVRARTQELESARETVERQRRQWEQLFWQAPAAICIFDGPEWIYQFVNPGYQAMFLGQELLGKRLLDVFPELADQELLHILRRVYDTGEPFIGTEVLVPLARTAGGPVANSYFDLTYLARRNEAGQIDGFVTYAYDVTERVLARRQIETLQAAALAAAQRRVQQREELYQLFAQTPAAIFFTRGPEHRYVYANEASQTLFAGRQLLGQAVADVLPGAEAQGLLALLDRVYATGKTFSGTEVPLSFAGKNGTPTDRRFFNFTYQAYREDDQVVGIATFAYEVTEQVLARQQVEQLNRELEARVLARTREVQEAQAATERERALLQALLTQAPVAISLFQGEEIRVTAANSMMAAIWGYTPEQVVGRPLVEGVPELRGQGFDELLRQVMRTQVPITGTETPAVLLRDGELKTTYYNFVYQPLYDAEGQVLGVIDVALEVTEQVEARRRIEQLAQEAQAARAEAERQRGELERVLEEAPVAIAVYRGPKYTIELANPTVARLWGRTREQLLGKGLFEALPEVAGLGYEELLDGVMATGVPYVAHAMEAQHDRNGRRETVYWDFVYVPMYEADGRISGAMVVATEVTAQVLARRQVEQLNQGLEARVQERTRQLSEQQALLRQILGQVPASIATLSGPSHRYTFFNELYQSLSAGRTELALSVAEVFPEVVAQGFVDLLDKVYATGEPFIGSDVPALLYDAALGRPRQYYIDFIYQPLFDAQQRVQGILVFILDVTDRSHARQLVEESQQQVQGLNEELAAINEELRATNEQLHTSNTHLTRTNIDLDTFVYTASHDLKAPITNIEGILQALRETLPAEVQQDEVVAHIMGLLDHTVGRFLVTIDQLTDLSRLQQTYDAPAELLALAPIVAGVVEDLAPAIMAATAQVHLEVPAGLAISFAPASLRSIIYNLLSNAVKYRDAARPAQVWLHAERQATTVVLTVRDNGLGLSASQLTRLFGVFQRLHTHVEGTGVGLYMIKRLIDNAGASIVVTSTLGVGSTFTVTFPV